MTQEQNKMREAFIKWAEEEGHEIGYMGDEDFYPESALDMWIGWQARAAYEHAQKTAGLEALDLALAYIRYIEDYSPSLHKEADGTPSIKQAILSALKPASTGEEVIV